MAFLNRGNAQIFYKDSGQGEPVIAIHGLIENSMYWGRVGNIISLRRRFITMDMRAHGRTRISGEPYGFDADTVGKDIIALADHLGLARFHLLTHSTGGFAAVRLAMEDSHRFATLMLTNTGSATAPFPGDGEAIRAFNDNFAQWFEKNDWDLIMAKLKKRPGPFFRGIIESDRADELMQLSRDMVGQGDRGVIAAFIRSFYTDPDPRVEGLRRISCPVLIVFGEKDDMFIESSRLMAREIPGARLIEYKGIGHMTAFEAPEPLAQDLLSFMETHPV
jgi:pimeloyl-ACP methyl ester carboxylesterase